MNLFLGLVLTISIISSAQADISWKEINKKYGITVYKTSVSGSSIVAFKGKVIIDASAKKIIWVLADKEHRKDWVDRLNINEELEVLSKTERIIYQSFDMPFLISNRDMVYKSVLSRDRKTGTYKLDMHSVAHAKSPKTVGVRAKLINSSYRVKPLGTNKSEVTVEILSDPRGYLPAWLVNIVQKSWPVKTLSGLRNQVKKDFVKEYRF